MSIFRWQLVRWCQIIISILFVYTYYSQGLLLYLKILIEVSFLHLYYIFRSEIPWFIHWITVISSQVVIFTLWKYQICYFHSVKITSECHVMYMQCNMLRTHENIKTCLACEINSIFNVKPLNILYLFQNKWKSSTGKTFQTVFLFIDIQSYSFETKAE